MIKSKIVYLVRNMPYSIRNLVFRLIGFNINNSDIRSDVFISNPDMLIIGNQCTINHSVKFYFGGGKAQVALGDNVFIGPDCLITTITHNIGNLEKRAGENVYKPITIGDGTWLGARCVVLPGVNIGKGCIIAAGAVVTSDIDDNTLCGGVPAKTIRILE